MRADVGLVAGTGIASRLFELGGKVCAIPTPFGLARGSLVDWQEKRVLLLNRHGKGHRTPPHAVNYRAMSWALRSVGAAVCFSTAACGSLRAEWGVGQFVCCTDFIDCTARNLTIYERDVVHTAVSPGFGPKATSALLASGKSLGIPLCQGVYLGMNGPRYETPAEIRWLATVGDLVGMTVSSEAVVMKEAGVDYGCLAVVTNLAAGIGEDQPSHEEVTLAMNAAGVGLVNLLGQAVREL